MQGQFTQRSPASHLRGRAPGGHLEDKAFCGQLAAPSPTALEQARHPPAGPQDLLGRMPTWKQLLGPDHSVQNSSFRAQHVGGIQ